jgi:hypothetical protein
MTEKLVTYHLSRQERETHYLYTDGESTCICDTTIPKDIRKLKSKGWEMISCDKYSDGTIVAAKFRAPSNLISARQYSPTKSKRTLTEEHKRKMQESRKNNSN